MGALGVIAEYNPFHNGHLYQLETAKKNSGAEDVVVVMSGNFTQRGLPAITDKYTRTHMAQKAGAGLVLELPVRYATHSAKEFATAGIAALAAIKTVDKLSFGCEEASIPFLGMLSGLLSKRETELEAAIAPFLKQGLSYPVARTQVLYGWLREIDSSAALMDRQAFSQLLSSPNTILALEYLCAMERMNWHPKLYPIARQGAGYHDLITNSDTDNMYPQSAGIASASGIRKCIETKNNLELIQNYIPDTGFALLSQAENQKFPVFADDFSDLLYYALLQETKGTKKEAADRLCHYEGVTPQLASRILGMTDSYTEFSAFAKQLQCKNFTRSHINRALLHIMLGIKKEETLENFSPVRLPYLRILGLSEGSSHLLRHAALPVISKMADVGKLPEHAQALFAEEVYACELYNRILYRKFGTICPGEYKHKNTFKES